MNTENTYIEKLEKMNLRLNALLGTPADITDIVTVYLNNKHYNTIAGIYSVMVDRLRNVTTRNSLPHGKGFILFNKEDIEKLFKFDIGAIELVTTSKWIYPYIHFPYHNDYKNCGLKKLNSIPHTREIGVYIDDYYYESVGNIYDPLRGVEIQPNIGEGFILFTKDDIRDLLKTNVEAVELIITDNNRLFIITHCI